MRQLGAEVDAIGISPNGFNVNDGVGSTHPKALQMRVLESNKQEATTVK